MAGEARFGLRQTVTSHAKTYSNSFPFLNGIPFTSHLLTVQNIQICTCSNGLGHPFKKICILSNGLVIRSVETSTRSNGLVICSEKNCIHSVQTSIRLNSLVIHSEKKLHPFERLGHPFGTNIHPLERLDHPFRKK